MPLSPVDASQRPDYWWAFGHSWLENQLGTRNQTGRPDGAFRAANDIEFQNWKNCAVTGSRLIQQGAAQGGYARFFQLVRKVGFGAPYVSQDGGLILGWGINDLGKSGSGATYLSAYKDALRAVVSRWRAGSIRENTDATISYGAGFTLASSSREWTSGNDYRTATTTTSATFTITIPSDFTGTPLVICYNGIVNGGTVTYSGTAGITGTFSTSAIIPSAELSHCPRIHRIKTLTAANAGQTIIGTVTALDASGSVDFDCYWIEAENPGPVIIGDIAKMNSLGYSGFTVLSGNSVATNDGLVDTWNAGIYAVRDEFDSMVQMAYWDQAIGKDASKLWSIDGVHPNEKGSGVLADAMLAAQRRLRPAAQTVTNPPTGTTAFMNSASPREGSLVRHMVAGANTWYGPDYRTYGTTLAAVAGGQYAIPIQVTIPNARISMLGIEAMNAVAGTAIRWGIYDDPGREGYPFSLMAEATSAGALTIPTAIGVVTSPAPNAAGSIDKPLDPGIFWLVVKFTTAGVTHNFRSIFGPNQIMPNVATTGAGGTSPMGWFLSGQGTGALPGRYPTGAAYADPVPMVSFRVT